MDEQRRITSTTWRALGSYIAWGLPSAPILSYVDALILGLQGEASLQAVAILIPPLYLTIGVIYPYFILRALVRQALERRKEDAPGARLERLLRLPWRAGFLTSCTAWTLGGFCFSLGICLQFDRPLSRVAVSTFIGICCGTVLAFPFGLTLERWMLPLVLEEQRQHPDVMPSGRGLSWPRQSWFLPFAFLASLVCAQSLSGCLVLARLLDERHGRMEPAELASMLAWACLLVLVLPTLTTWLLARRLATGTQAMRTAIEALASGKVRAPDWVSTDELGDMAHGMNAVLARLRQFPLSLRTSALRLQEAGGHLHHANAEQDRSLTAQAELLHAAQATCEQLRETSNVAAERADEVMRVSERAEALGLQGEKAIEQSMEGLASLQFFVHAIQERLEKLRDGAVRIDHISRTVKDLAEQSNMLALNAAIESARAGEHGKGFGVVSREIRVLANESANATVRIRAILDEVSRAIRDAADLGEQGTQRVSDGLTRMNASGSSLRDLLGIAQENAVAARQIAVAVTQQREGLTHLGQALSDLSRHMNDTLERLGSTQEAAGTLRAVSDEVALTARRLDAD